MIQDAKAEGGGDMIECIKRFRARNFAQLAASAAEQPDRQVLTNRCIASCNQDLADRSAIDQPPDRAEDQAG